ncbi:MAG: polyprenyl synthetase family protein [Desulfobacterales bacterium]|nr:polyprenyl synthetase family protein [Desulfobacterales bacterium]
MFDLKTYLKHKSRLINGALNAILKTTDTPDRLLKAMTYALLAGGKRIRPILCLAAAETVDGDPQDVMPAACALEMIHTYSLIHDDLPAMDDDDMRRGQPTCHKAFDEATAILAGDALLTLAFQMLSSMALDQPQQAAKWLRAIHLISRAAGYCGMIQGQMLDMASEKRRFTLDELKSMHRLKTGALIEASVCCGAELVGVNDTQIQMLEKYAQNIGLAFQVTDDILNVEGDPEIMGKAVGTDQRRRKSTYPALLGLAESKEFAAQLVDDALGALESFDQKADPLRAIARYIRERNR